MKYFTLLLLFIFSFQLSAQSNVVEASKTYTQAFVDREYQKVINMTLPQVVEMGGGNTFMEKDLFDERETMVENGMDYISAEIGQTSPTFNNNGDSQVLVDVTYKIVSNKSELDVFTKLLAISSDEGNSWHFLDIEKYDKESLKSFYPNLSSELEF